MKKDLSIETLRGLAIILVVGLHITNDAPIAPAQGIYNYLAFTFSEIRLPLFTVISGFLYGLRPVENNGLPHFFKGKVRRILLPLLVVASCEFLSKSILPGVNEPESLENIWKVWIFGYEHYWFLQAIFTIFMVFAFLGHVGIVFNFTNWLKAIIATSFLFLVFPYTGLSLSLFSIGAATYIVPFFVLGIGLAMHSERLLQPKVIKGLVVVFIITFISQQLAWFTDLVSFDARRPVAAFLLSLSACVLLFKIRVPIWGLATVGSFAYTIYLYQGFGMSLGRRFISDIGPHFYFVLMIFFTLAFGIAVEQVGKKIPYIRTLFLGLKS